MRSSGLDFEARDGYADQVEVRNVVRGLKANLIGTISKSTVQQLRRWDLEISPSISRRFLVINRLEERRKICRIDH